MESLVEEEREANLPPPPAELGAEQTDFSAAGKAGLVKAINKSPPLRPMIIGEGGDSQEDDHGADDPVTDRELSSAGAVDGKKQGELFLKDDLTFAEGQLNQCERVAMVWTAPGQIGIFCATTKIHRKSSKLRKLKVIGEKVERLKLILPVMPPEWPKIYAIASLGDADFERLKKDGRLHPEITFKELTAVIKGEPTPAPPNKARGAGKGRKIELTIDLAGLTRDHAVRVYQEIVTLSETEDFKLSASADLQKLIDAAAK